MWNSLAHESLQREKTKQGDPVITCIRKIYFNKKKQQLHLIRKKEQTKEKMFCKNNNLLLERVTFYIFHTVQFLIRKKQQQTKHKLFVWLFCLSFYIIFLFIELWMFTAVFEYVELFFFPNFCFDLSWSAKKLPEI